MNFIRDLKLSLKDMKNKILLSVVISAYNEEKKIADCLTSVNWADEIIVIDNSSIDNTKEIALKHGAIVYTRKNNLMLNINKNYGFTRVRNEWVLSLDADERITDELVQEIDIKLKTNKHINGFWIPRKNIIFGKWIQNSIWWPDYQLRLFKKGFGKFPEIDVHEMIDITGDTEKLESPMLHYNYDSVSQYIMKMDKVYTENAVQNYISSGKELNWYSCIRMPVSDFLKTFFLQKGYKDGLHGLVLSSLQAFYSLVIFAKVWEKNGFPEYNNKEFLKKVINEFNKNAIEFRYWIYTAFIENGKNDLHKLFYKLKRYRVNRQIKDK